MIINSPCKKRKGKNQNDPMRFVKNTAVTNDGDVAENNATVIVTSHSLRELEDLCDHLSLLHKGGLVLFLSC